MTLITLDQAKIQCRIPLDSTEFDEDLELKMHHATALVIDHIKRPEHGWSSEITGSPASTVDDLEFLIAQAAILKVLANLWRFRGDDTTPQAQQSPLTPGIKDMLIPLRDPALA